MMRKINRYVWVTLLVFLGFYGGIVMYKEKVRVQMNLHNDFMHEKNENTER